jgi:hypothetical protein
MIPRRTLFFLSFVLVGRVEAQVTTTVSAIVSAAEHETTLGGVTTRVSGTVFGGQVVVSPISATEFSASITGGSLSAATPQTDNQSWTDIQVSGSVFALPWLAFQLGVDTRGYSGTTGQQRWVSVIAGAEARAPLFDGAARALFRASLLPLVDVSGQPRPDFAISIGTGFQLLRAPGAAAVIFSYERYDFPSTEAFGARRDQVAMLGLQLGVRFPK